MTQSNEQHPVIATDIIAGYGGEEILHRVSMFAPQNKVTVILGSSGCGKTTLLKNLIRLYDPWAGSIRLFGEEILDMDEPAFHHILKKIGVLFQYGALLNSISVKENVAIPMNQHTDLNEELIDHLVQVKLGLVDMAHASRKSPAELSGGMKKRAALARAIALDPPLLFCDEPSAGLDPITTEGLDRLLLKMRDNLGMTLVIVSHTIASIQRIADHVVFIDNGDVLFEGSYKEARKTGIEQIDYFFEMG